MRIGRVAVGDQPTWCVFEDGQAYELEGDRFTNPKRGKALGATASLKVLRPVEDGNKVIGLWSNWRAREDRDGPSFFIKSPNTLINPGEPIVYPDICERVVYESELAIVIGKRCRSVSVADAPEHIFGFSIFNDVTALGMKVNTVVPALGIGLHYQAGKAFDTFGVMGPCIANEIDGDKLDISVLLNGKTTTEANTSNMIFHSDDVVSFLSQFMTLNPGDVISCGTPLQMADIAPGDQIDMTIEGIGTLSNPVIAQ
jgi:2-keto-4-pentenoate hydratase/2-oxohepta-3-ene-1,7-dioic acid hydratase in catechol pathway